MNIPLLIDACHGRLQLLPYADAFINSTLTSENRFKDIIAIDCFIEIDYFSCCASIALYSLRNIT